MASPSPLDRCWMVKDSLGSSPMMSAVRTAVETHWPETLRAATSALGDEALAAEIMEVAIEQAVAYLADHPPWDQGDVNAVLSRFCKQEVRRRRKQRTPFVFIDFSQSRHQIELHRAIAHVSCIRLIPSSLRAFAAPAADTLNASQFHEIEKTCKSLGRLVLGLGCRSYRSPDSARSRQRRTSRSIPLVRSFQFLADSPVPAQPHAHPLTN